MLHISDGDSVGQSFAVSAIPGEYLPWGDILHDGAVPSLGALEKLSDVRARELHRFGFGTYEAIRAGFAVRDAALAAFRTHDEVVLWFDRGVVDQLQLMQILAWFAQRDLGATRLTLIQVGGLDRFTPFYGMGQLTGEQLTQLFPKRALVTAVQLAGAQRAWHGFCSPDPELFNTAFAREFDGLPYLRIALERVAQEYPWRIDGLSRMQRQILRAVANGAQTQAQIYVAARAEETTPWGDSSVELRVEGLADARVAALQRTDAGFAITEAGRAILAQKQDWFELCEASELPIGGVDFTKGDRVPRWDETKRRLRSAPAHEERSSK